MTDRETPAAEGQLNKAENSVVQAEHTTPLVYFKPDSQELVLLAETVSGDFDTHWREMALCVDDFHKANEHYSSMIEQYGLLYAQADKRDQLSPAETAIQEAENALKEKRDELKKHIGDFTAGGAKYKDVVELIPIKGSSQNGGRALPGSKYIYVNKKYFDDLGAGARHNVSIRGEDLQSATSSIYQNGRIDIKKLREQLTKVKIPKPEFKDVKFGELKDVVDVDEVLVEWADSWNDCLGSDDEGKPRSVDISAGAQFMRFTANLSSLGKWNPNNGKVSYKGEASSVINVASGTANAKIFFPDRIGWPLRYQPEKGSVINPIDMGMLRLFLESDLVGFVGASVQAEAQVMVTTYLGKDGAKQILSGQSSGRLPRFSERHTTGAEFNNQMNKNEDGVSCNAEVFGGARAEFKLKGGMQWLEPEASVKHRELDEKEKKAAAKFVDFCTVGGSVAAMAGAGVGGAFQCDFVNGKFCFRIAASLCCGVGAKGAFNCEVGYENFKNFGAWLIYQLFALDYHYLELIGKNAFEAFTQLSVMQMIDKTKDFYKEAIDASQQAQSIYINFTVSVSELIKDVKQELNASKKRNQLATNINSNAKDLLSYTPEAKGILLYLLTRHSTGDHMDINNYGNGFIPDIYADRKEAVINVLCSIQTRNEWNQVMLHRTVNGKVVSSGSVVKQEDELREFLHEGFSRRDDFEELYKDISTELDIVYSRLKDEVSWGYALAMNNTMEYQLNTGINPLYPHSGNFGPYDENREMMV